MFVPNRLPRKSLHSGDVVALALSTTGEMLAAAKVRKTTVDVDDDASSTTLQQEQYTLIPSKKATMDDEVVFLEVVRDGPWIGFKSWLADNAMLQAKKRGTYRLAFFSPRFGVYEQWGCEDGVSQGGGLPLDNIHWASTAVTLRNRKVPSVVLKVELHRVGVCRYDTPQRGSLEEVQEVEEETGVAFSAGGPPPPPRTTQSIQTMSTMMVNEWIKFVEKEKARRHQLQAKVDRATEDVEGLRRWAAQQIQCARQDVQEEIELLLGTLNDRNAALADVRARLDTRIQWGAALLEAKKATVLGRRVILAWKAKTARTKYCEAVVNKLRKRSRVRAALRALDTWRDEVEERKDMQKRLRAGVRRMSHLKIQAAFSGWRRTSHDAHEIARFEAARNQDAVLIAYSQRAKGAFAAWRKRAARSKEARRLLGFAANRAKEQLVASVFAAWTGRVQHVKALSDELGRRVQMRERTRLSGAVLDAWRLAADDGHAEKIEHGRSVAFDVKKTLKKALAAWRGRAEEVKRIEMAAEAASVQRTRAAGAAALVLWRQHAAAEAATRSKLVDFVYERALRCMKEAMWFWREHAAFEKIRRRYVKICTERRELRQAKSAFGAWRAATRRSNKTFGGLLEFTDAWSRRRMRRALEVWRGRAAEKARERALEVKAVKWRVGRLSARVIRALQAETERQAALMDRLRAVGQNRSLALKRVVWNAWQFEVEETSGREANLRNFRLRKAWHVVNQAFAAWRNTAAEEKFLNRTAVTRKAHINAMRARWALGAWRDAVRGLVDDRLQDRKADNWHRFKAASGVFKAWRAHKDSVRAVESHCEERRAALQLQTKHGLLLAWRGTAEYRGHLRSVLQTITNARAVELQQAVFKAWRDKCAASTAEAVLVLRSVNKLSELRARQAFAHWRQVADDAKGKTMYMDRMQALVDRKHARSTLKGAFVAWRTRRLDIEAGLRQFEERSLTKLAVVKSTAFGAWRNQAERAVPIREKALESVVQRRSSRLMIQAFVGWRHETTVQSRNDLVVLHAVDRISFRMMKEAMFAWRIATVERKRRRDVMVSLMERSFARRLGEAFSAWRQQATEDIRVRQNLERCIMQKRIAYELYRESYWETVDEELQETLRAMFREAGTDDEDLDVDRIDGKYHGMNADDVVETSELFCRSVDLEDGPELEEIALAFESKRRELSAQVRAAVQQGNASPGHAMTPPKRDLNVLEPLSRFFSSALGREQPTLASGTDSLALSISSLGSSICCTEDLEGLSDLEDPEGVDFDFWSSCGDDDVEGSGSASRQAGFLHKGAGSNDNVSRKALFELGVLIEPQSPRILAKKCT